MCQSRTQDDDTMTMSVHHVSMCLSNSQYDSMTICPSRPPDDDSMTMCQSRPQDDDSMHWGEQQRRTSRRAREPCCRAGGRALVDVSL